ncbi:MAG: T9SS type A sorting domain-containing protein [Saprospiraceae bacterium]|nr:T9SS type A sorting domain-containing protein [Saprospiraceae bacterium]
MKNLLFFAWGLLISNLHAQESGILDTSFAQQGWSTVDLNTFESTQAFAVQPDGKIVAVGFTEKDDTSKFSILRYLPNGSIDTTFGNKGVHLASFFPHINIAQAVALQSDGKIVVAGYTANHQLTTNNNEELVVMRLNPDGQPDNTFGTNGAVILNIGFNERPVSIRLLSDGSMLIVGNVFYGKNSRFFIYKLSSSGNVDMNFGANGYKLVYIVNGLWNYCQAMEILPDGKILLAGEVKTAIESSFAIIRLNSDGGYDTSFSGDGKATFNISPQNDGAQAMLLLPDDKILLAGYASDDNDKTHIALLRINSDGTLDNTFGNGGTVLDQTGTDYAAVADLCLTPMGNIIVAGTANRYPSYFDFFLLKYKTDGTLDDGFGNQGITFTDYDGHYDGISDAQILPEGKILVAGTGVNTSNSISEYLLAQYWLGESTGTEDIKHVSATAWVFPNPTSTRRIVLSYNLKEEAKIIVELYSMNGELLGTLSKFDHSAGKQNESVALPAGLSAGTYLIGLRSDNQQTFVKIIVQ